MGKRANQKQQLRTRSLRVRVCQFASLLVCQFAVSGCLERTITITSDPPDAIVWLNDVEVGRTPVKTGFTYYGDYDVRLRKEGYEPVITHREAAAPVYEWAPLDLAATSWPGRIRTNLTWHFELTPSPEPKAEEPGLTQRARELRETAASPAK